MNRYAAGLVLLVCLSAAALCAKEHTVRIATFNCSLNRPQAGGLIESLTGGRDPQARAIAEIIRRVRPDILLLNEFDYDTNQKAADLFQKHYLAAPSEKTQPIEYPYIYSAPVNTGVPSGADLNRDGRIQGPEDAFGYGQFPGQYGMLLLSRYRIRTHQIRTFQKFLWKDMPGALLPDDPVTPETGDWYSPEALKALRLSSKSHWDVPVDIGGRIIHCLISHPTPPVFDGPEDRNGRRNHDEIRFWSDYITPGKADYVYDDNGHPGGLDTEADFVILGDLNADPEDGDGIKSAISALLSHDRVQDPRPAGDGAEQATRLQQGVNQSHRGKSRLDTYQSAPGRTPGNLRLDYVLPSRVLAVREAGVFWPIQDDPRHALVAGPPYQSSDHRLVYADTVLSD